MAKKRIPSKTATTTSKPLMTWYACGQAMPAERSPDDAVSNVAKQSMPNLVPTTYEAADAPDATVEHEMCVILPLALPKDRKVFFLIPFLGVMRELTECE